MLLFFHLCICNLTDDMSSVFLILHSILRVWEEDNSAKGKVMYCPEETTCNVCCTLHCVCHQIFIRMSIYRYIYIYIKLFLSWAFCWLPLFHSSLHCLCGSGYIRDSVVHWVGGFSIHAIIPTNARLFMEVKSNCSTAFILKLKFQKVEINCNDSDVARVLWSFTERC